MRSGLFRNTNPENHLDRLRKATKDPIIRLKFKVAMRLAGAGKQNMTRRSFGNSVLRSNSR